MPTALGHALVNQFFILIRRWGLFSLVTFLIAKQASCNNVILLGRSTILVSLKMLAGTLKALGLTKSNLMLGGEFMGVFRPHGLAAIKAVTGLTDKSGRAGFYERFARFCHVTGSD
jgi:hypothetical protein